MTKTKASNDVVRSNVSLTDDNTTEKESQVVVKKRYKSSYTLTFLLYPDNADHGKCLAEIIRRYDYAYILHDKDEKEMDFKEHCLDPDNPKDRELIKKSHYHVLTFHPSCKRASQMAKELGIEKRFCQEVTDRNAMICYLTHMGDRGKHQYSFSDVVCNRPSIYLEGLGYRLTDTEKLEKMIRIIQNKKCTQIDFAILMLAKEGMAPFAMKHYPLVRDLVECVNANVYRIMYPPTSLQSQLKERALREYRSDQIETLSADDDLPF